MYDLINVDVFYKILETSFSVSSSFLIKLYHKQQVLFLIKIKIKIVKIICLLFVYLYNFSKFIVGIVLYWSTSFILSFFFKKWL